jgi:methylated-DNA-[protein]-cysteine S-methyltransferase
MKWSVLASPIGDIGLGIDAGVVAGLSFGRPRGGIAEIADGSDLAAAVRAGVELGEYFAGERVTFDTPYVVLDGSEFERAVWAQIAAIPYGETTSYGTIATAVGQPGAAQAVGIACNRNPVPILVPCHRVIGSDGKLVGFGGGLSRKRFLLALEARVHIERTFAP